MGRLYITFFFVFFFAVDPKFCTTYINKPSLWALGASFELPTIANGVTCKLLHPSFLGSSTLSSSRYELRFGSLRRTFRSKIQTQPRLDSPQRPQEAEDPENPRRFLGRQFLIFFALCSYAQITVLRFRKVNFDWFRNL